MNDKELVIWKDVVGYEWLYMVSNLWEVKSINRITKYKKWYDHWHKEIILKYSISKSGYCKITLHKDNKKYYYLLHRMVWIAFIENIKNYKQINHIDGNKTNNCVSNLEWCDASYNSRHSYDVLWRKWSKAWLWKLWINNPSSKKTIQMNPSWDIIKVWNSVRDIQRDLWYYQWAISSCCRWHNKTSYWFIWKYI